jgi:hypothetical protein
MYVVPAFHMEEFYSSGSFWTRPKDNRKALESQLHMLMKKDGDFFSKTPFGEYKHNSDTTIVVPLDKNGRQLDMIAGVHHASDKYARTPWPFGKLCLKDLFID